MTAQQQRDGAEREISRSSWWTQMRQVGAHLWDEATSFGPGWPPTWLRAAGAVGAAVAAVVAGLAAITFLVRGLAAAGQQMWSAPGPVSGPRVLKIMTTPVRAWLEAHSGGLILTGQQLWAVWVMAGVVFFVLAVAGTVAGRIGWVLFGTSAVWMTYAATPGSGAVTAAALVAGAWVVASVPALRRSRFRQIISINDSRDPVDQRSGRFVEESTSTRTRGEVDAAEHRAVDVVDDVAAIAAGVLKVLLRRWAVRERILAGHPRPAWTVTASPGQGFRARDDAGREAAGSALSAEAVTEVLATLSEPVGVRPRVRFTNEPPPAPDAIEIRWVHHQDLDTSMDDFLDASATELAQLGEYLGGIREEWPSDRIPARIIASAAQLNHTHPLVLDEHLDLWGFQAATPGSITSYGWVDPATVIASPANTWNDFADHRPEQVPAIITKLVHEPDTIAAARFVLGTEGIVYLQRLDGPAGPIHVVTMDGTHRTHALRILQAPLLAAEISTSPLPLYLDECDVRDKNTPANEDIASLWRGLLSRGLVDGVLTGERILPRLELHHAAAAWLLLPAQRSIAISNAYDKVYPGALASLGIPAGAITSAHTWRSWLSTLVRRP